MRIGKREVGPGLAPYVIAEMACAHDGSTDKAKRISEVAARAGADAVQLQFFVTDALMTPLHDAYALVRSLELGREQWADVHAHARSLGIDVFVCTYDVPSAKLALKLGVEGIKLNSSDLSNPDLLGLVAASGVPFTIGTGASAMEEIAQAVRVAGEGASRAILMHGVQNFPTAAVDLHIARIRLLRSLFGLPVGYQDHSPAEEPFSRVADLLAVGAGACVLEKHITLDRSERGTDWQAALEPSEFADYVALVRQAGQAMGSAALEPLSESDLRYRRFQKKSVVAARGIKAGETVTRDMLAFLRSLPGLSPSAVDEVLGRRAARDIALHENVLPSDVE